jgi:hypothetical protein
MKKLLAIVVLGLFLITPSQADDIRDFQIEGMSVGDSLQNYIDNNKFKHYETADYFKDNKITLYETQLSDFQDFEYVDISFYTKDNKKKILSVSGKIITNYENCIKKKKEISSSVEKVLEGIKYVYQEKTDDHSIDKTGKSKIYTNYFYLGTKEKNKSRDLVAVQCLDFSNQLPYPDGLKLYVVKGEYADWIENEAYK